MRGFLKPIATVALAGIAPAVVALATIIVAGASGVANAQQSADAIIAALKPTGNLAAGSTRGIKLGGSPTATRPASSAQPVAAAASRPRVREEAPPDAGPSVNLTVNFPTGSAELTPAARGSLDALGKALASSDLATFRFRIEGHTDNVGSRDANLSLSQQRAEAIVSYLTTQYNVAPARLEAVGMGQERPLVETAPQTPEARNRRVQVINLGA
jgi:outer membrane protein OmpA-like peptidoglycan-associated protein